MRDVVECGWLAILAPHSRASLLLLWLTHRCSWGAVARHLTGSWAAADLVERRAMSLAPRGHKRSVAEAIGLVLDGVALDEAAAVCRVKRDTLGAALERWRATRPPDAARGGDAEAIAKIGHV
jgi:hypothetical protein